MGTANGNGGGGLRQATKGFVLAVARSVPAVERVARFIVSNSPNFTDTYAYLRRRFIENGKGHACDQAARAKIVERFERIDREVPIGSTPSDGLFLAEMLLNLQAPGEIVECGCYAGGSSSKISIIAKIIGRKVTVFDSYEGLPVSEQKYQRDMHCRRNAEWTNAWEPGAYTGRLEEVQGNIERYGEREVCSFVKGWFNQTLTDANLPKEIGFAFADVDLADSARDCFEAVWPRLSEKGIYVTHDTAYIKVLQELFNPTLWREKFKSTPPPLFGAGYGLSNDSPHIGYFVKGEGLEPEYLKRLTIDK